MKTARPLPERQCSYACFFFKIGSPVALFSRDFVPFGQLIDSAFLRFLAEKIKLCLAVCSSAGVQKILRPALFCSLPSTPWYSNVLSWRAVSAPIQPEDYITLFPREWNRSQSKSYDWPILDEKFISRPAFRIGSGSALSCDSRRRGRGDRSPARNPAPPIGLHGGIMKEFK